MRHFKNSIICFFIISICILLSYCSESSIKSELPFLNTKWKLVNISSQGTSSGTEHFAIGMAILTYSDKTTEFVSDKKIIVSDSTGKIIKTFDCQWKNNGETLTAKNGNEEVVYKVIYDKNKNTLQLIDDKEKITYIYRGVL